MGLRANRNKKYNIEMDIKWETTTTIKKMNKIHYPVLHFMLAVWKISALIAIGIINDCFRVFHTAMQMECAWHRVRAFDNNLNRRSLPLSRVLSQWLTPHSLAHSMYSKALWHAMLAAFSNWPKCYTSISVQTHTKKSTTIAFTRCIFIVSNFEEKITLEPICCALSSHVTAVRILGIMCNVHSIGSDLYLLSVSNIEHHIHADGMVPKAHMESMQFSLENDDDQFECTLSYAFISIANGNWIHKIFFDASMQFVKFLLKCVHSIWMAIVWAEFQPSNWNSWNSVNVQTKFQILLIGIACMPWWLDPHLICWQQINRRLYVTAVAAIAEFSISLEISSGLPTQYFIERMNENFLCVHFAHNLNIWIAYTKASLSYSNCFLSFYKWQWSLYSVHSTQFSCHHIRRMLQFFFRGIPWGTIFCWSFLLVG